jgi:formamidopyrimidine-DNA glycosylase
LPELPEVETVRAGLQRWVCGRRLAGAEVLHPRTVRRHEAGALDVAERLTGRTVSTARRRGKYLWLELDALDDCLVLHLGMSGQLLVLPREMPDGRHLRARFRFDDDGPELRFVDQRTFGGLQVARLVGSGDGPGAVPDVIAHIARDPLDHLFDDRAFSRALRRRRTTIKRALLDQTLVSGVGNIYADEALWRARLHGDRPTDALTNQQALSLLRELRAVFADALAAGGTSFDSLYVNVNGESGYFDRSLNAYGRAGQPCRRCGEPITRSKWMNRSSYFCRRCQPVPRPRRSIPA